MHRTSFGLAASLVFALVLSPRSSYLFAGDVRLKAGKLMLAGEPFDVRGVGYSTETNASSGCGFARDLPLAATMGANTVRTYRLLPDDESSLTSILETTGLYWLADFPLDSFYDSGRSLAERSDEILAEMRAYAGRFRGERRLIGFVIGVDVAQNYSSKFAGPVSDYYALLAKAAELLAQIQPENPPLLAASTSDLNSLALNSEGLSFWIWDAVSVRSLTPALDRLKSSSKPVLVSGYGIDVFNPATESVDEQGQSEIAIRLTREIQASGFLLGGIYRSLTDSESADSHFGIFRLAGTERAGIYQVRPRAIYKNLASLWGGKAPIEWQLQMPPELGAIQHAASGRDRLSPGTLARLAGSALEVDHYSANGVPWPFHLNHTCLCIGGRTAPLGMVAPGAATAQIPWDLPPGEHAATIYRAGLATNVLLTQIDRYSPGVFEEGILRAGTSCRVTRESGVRPGEILELYATGLGPGAPSWTTPTALINGVKSEVLYSGTLPTLVGLNQVNLRVSPLTPPGPNSTLLLQVEDASSAPYSLAVAAPTDRFGISMAALDSEIAVQAGGPARIVTIQTEGRNGYCGPVLLGAFEKPEGLILQAPIGSTGDRIPLEVRASSSALPQSVQLSLSGQAAGAISGTASLKVNILAGTGETRVRVSSGGFLAGPAAQFDWNGHVLYSASGGSGRGINVLAINPATGVFATALNFDTWGDESASDRLISYLSTLPTGTLLLLAVADDGTFQLPQQAREQIAKLFGSSMILNLGYQHSWAMIGRVGAAAPIAESSSPVSQVTLDQKLTFPMTAP